MDRIRNKVDLIRQNAEALRLTCVRAFCFNSTRAVTSDPALLDTDGTAHAGLDTSSVTSHTHTHTFLCDITHTC